MRKTAFLSTFVAVLALSLNHLSAQAYTYILYDGNTMDRLDHQFLGVNNSAFYTSYRMIKNAGEMVFLDIGIESPRIHPNEPPSMVTWQNARIDQDFIVGINTGSRKVYICKKLDSGWAVQPIGSGIYMSNFNNVLTFVSSNYDFQADFKQTLGNNLSLNTRGIASPSNVYYVGELRACDKTAKTFKVFPSETRKYETTITVLPQLGLIRENAESCPTYELVGINGRDVCSYLNGGTMPAQGVAQGEPTPETVPGSYSVVTQPYVPVETTNTEISEPYVNTKNANTVVENSNNITKTDYFGETPTEVPITYNQVPRQNDVPTTYNTIGRPAASKVDCNLTAGTGEHIIQSGENLYSISRRYGLSVASLREWNNLSSDMLYPCATLRIVAPIVEQAEKPSMEVAKTNDIPMGYNTVVKVTPKKVGRTVETKVVECEVEFSEGEHVVLQGESLYGIGKKYGATEAQLKAWNKLKSNVIHPCQKLIIAAPKTNITAKSVDVPKQYSMVVKPKTVAKTTATKVTAKGVTLKNTAYVKSGTGLHVVLKGETVASLAKKYGISEADFRRINFMGENESVSVGQVIREKTCACTIEEAEDHSLALNPIPVTNDVPGGYNYIGSKSSTSSSTVTAKGINRKYHVVQTSETLYTIAKQYGKSISDIRRLNNLDENEVIIPHQLILLE